MNKMEKQDKQLLGAVTAKSPKNVLVIDTDFQIKLYSF